MDTIKNYFINEKNMPLVLEPLTHDLDIATWVHNNNTDIQKALRQHGAILFRGFDINSIASFEKFVSTMNPDLFSEYGDLPKEGDKTYKSTPYPEDQKILFHNESSHMHCWPLKQWFCCLQPSVEGGETPIIDCRKIYQALPTEILEQFKQKKLKYVRNFIEGIDVSWQAFFHTDNKSVVEQYCKQNGIEFEWKKNNGLRTSQTRSAVTVHPVTNEPIFFNQIQLHHSYFLPTETREFLKSIFPPEGFPRNVSYGDGTPIEDSAMATISQLYDDLSVSFSWEKGDILMLDNMLTAHARNAFKGARKIVVAMAEMIYE